MLICLGGVEEAGDVGEENVLKFLSSIHQYGWC